MDIRKACVFFYTEIKLPPLITTITCSEYMLHFKESVIDGGMCVFDINGK